MVAETKPLETLKILEDQQLNFLEKDIESFETPNMFNGLSEEMINVLKKVVNYYSISDKDCSALINLIKSHSRKVQNDVEMLKSKQTDQIIYSETTKQMDTKCKLPNDNKSGYGGMLDEKTSEMVMFPTSQPHASQIYAIHAVNHKIADNVNAQTLICDISVAVPQETSSQNCDGLPFPVNASNIGITTAVSPVNEHIRQNDSSINLALSAAEINSLKKKVPYPNIIKPMSVCSDQKENSLQENYHDCNLGVDTNVSKCVEQFYAFCENMNSPEDTPVEDSCVPDHQEGYMDCVNSPNHINVPSSSASSLMESNQMFVTDKQSKLNSGDISMDELDTFSLNFHKSNYSASKENHEQKYTTTFYANNANDDTNTMNVYSNKTKQLHNLASVLPYNSYQDCNNTSPLFDTCAYSPSSTVSSTYDLSEGNVMNSVNQCSPLQESNDICDGSPYSTVSIYGFCNENDVNLTNDDSASELAKLPNISSVSRLINTSENLEWLDDINMCELDEAPIKKQKFDDPKYKHNFVLNKESQQKNKLLPNMVSKVDYVVKKSGRKSNCTGSDRKYVLQEYSESPLNHPVFNSDEDGDLPLHICIAKGDERCIDIIKIMDGRLLDTQNKIFQTPLHVASYIDDTVIMDVLLQAGADPQMVDKEGSNIIHHICEKGSLEAMKLVEQFYYSKNPTKVAVMMDTCNYEGMTPLHIVTKKYIPKEKKDPQDLEIIKCLLQLGCSLDIQDMKTGATVLVYALEYAQSTNDWALAKIFIEHGAKLNIPTFAGMYPLDYVCVTDNLELAKDLILRGAESGIKNDFPNAQMKVLVETELRKRRRKRNRDNNSRRD